MDYGGDGTVFDDHLLFNLSHERLSSNIALPVKVYELPQNASDPNYIKINRLFAAETVTLTWQWEFREAGEPQNNAQGDSLSFTINYMLEEFPPTGGGEEGDGAPPPPTHYTIETSMVGIEGIFPIGRSGEILETIEATSADGMLTVNIPKGTIAKDKDGKRLKSLQAAVNESPPQPPGNAYIIALAYNFGPAGATFSPAITLTWSYAPDALPEGVAEEDLVIAYYKEEVGEWVELDSTVDTETKTITAKVSHFTTLVIIGTITLSPTPAAFSVGSLSISPSIVDIGEMVTISVLVANTGGKSGSCKVTLKINGVVEVTKEVTVNAGFSKEVTLTVSKDIAGIYSVDVDGLNGLFTVNEEIVQVEHSSVTLTALAAPGFNTPIMGKEKFFLRLDKLRAETVLQATQREYDQC